MSETSKQGKKQIVVEVVIQADKNGGEVDDPRGFCRETKAASAKALF
jgi:hypothetical protein